MHWWSLAIFHPYLISDKLLIMKYTVIAIIFAVALVVSTIMFTSNSKTADGGSQSNVSIVDGKQIIDLRAKGGYAPRSSFAKAGMPTILRVTTNGTFDCSSAIRIPSMNISRNLSATGIAEIDLGNPYAGTLNGTCGMGMYPFEIQFNS